MPRTRPEARPHAASIAETACRALAVCLVALFSLSSCGVRTGYVRIAVPHGHASGVTKALREKARGKVAKSLETLTAGGVQEGFGAREAISAALRGGGRELPSVQPQPSPSPTAAAPADAFAPLPGAVQSPTLPSPYAATAFQRTLGEQVDDAMHVENELIEAELLYAGDVSYLGPRARAYLIRFDIGLFPQRQSYLMYPFLFLRHQDVFNFTEDWFAQVEFALPEFREGGCNGSGASRPADSMLAPQPLSTSVPALFVYDVDPRYDVLTANESLSMDRSFALSALYATPEATFQADYARRLEELFAQYRRYPLQLGFVEGPYAFSWSFGPRRQIKERSFWAYLNPFLGTYSVTQRLEPGSRHVQAIIVIPDIDKISDRHFLCFDRKAPQPIDFREKKGQIVKDYAEAIKGVETMRSETPGSLSLPILVRATYVELDRPDVAYPVGVNSERLFDVLTVRLPLDRSPSQWSGTRLMLDPTAPHRSSLLGTISVGGADFQRLRPISITIRDVTQGNDLAVQDFTVVPATRGERADSLRVRFARPTKPANPDLAAVELAAYVRTDETEYKPDLEDGAYLYDASRGWRTAVVAPAKDTSLVSHPTSGHPGQLLTIAVGADLLPPGSDMQARLGAFLAGSLSSVRLGGLVIGKTDLIQLPDARAIGFTIPELPGRGQGHTVDIVLELKDAQGKASHRRVGSFTYVSTQAK